MKIHATLTAQAVQELTTIATGQVVTASQESRTITGIVAPYGVLGATSAGMVRFRRGAIQLPDDLSRVKLLTHHTNTPGTPPEAVGVAIAAEDTAEGLRMTFRVPETPAGNDALVTASAGVKDSFSVELIDVQTSGDTVVSGRLTVVAQVPLPAFEGARVTSVAASHHELPHENTHPGGTTMTTTQRQRLAALRGQAQLTQAEGTELAELALLESQNPDDGADDGADDGDGDGADDQGDQAGQAGQAGQVAASAHAPSTLTATARPQAPASRAGAMTASSLFATLAAVGSGERSPELTAALEDVAYSGSPFADQPEYVGELWSGVEYRRKWIPLLDTSKPLTSLKVTGWRWVEGPEVDDWAGDKSDVPSNPVSWEEEPFTASRLAGAHDIAREWFDFGNAAAIEAFYRYQANDYAKKSDRKARAGILATATGTTTVTGNLLKAAAIAAAEVETYTDGVEATAIAVNSSDYLNLLDVTNQDLPAFLRDVLKISPENFVRDAAVPAGTVVALTKPAAKFRELPGAPIRVTAEHISKGGRDSGLFGYYLFQPELAEGIRKVTFTPAA